MKTKSLQRSLGSIALGFESFIIFFATLAAFGLRVYNGPTVWVVGLSLSIIAVGLPGILGRKGGYAAGWILQLVLLGISILTIFYSALGYGYLVFSIIFIGIWGWAMLVGKTTDTANRVLAAKNNDQNGNEEIQ
jgi:hypothetical protein